MKLNLCEFEVYALQFKVFNRVIDIISDLIKYARNICKEFSTVAAYTITFTDYKESEILYR